MTLPNGVTALCSQTSQCWENHWCHQIGYNGLGFCCPAPESASRQGHCEARVPRHMTNCAAECRSDVDCPTISKCCFDGCGLKCMNAEFEPNPFQHRPASKIVSASQVDLQKTNKDIINPLLAECPDLGSSPETQSCTKMCHTDSDCTGLRRCCSHGCSQVCIYPQKTTPCIHRAITHEIYVLRNTPKCTPAGNYEQSQCDDDRCFCVDPITGDEIPNTGVPIGNEPYCQSIQQTTCPIISCSVSCPHGHLTDDNGCKTCACKNPCEDVRCPQGQICITATVQCFQRSNCPPQPRCIVNACREYPYTRFSGIIEQCDDACPIGYWCNNVGYPGNGGVCCPEIVTAKNGQQIVQEPHAIHSGSCPSVSVGIDNNPSQCHAECHFDDECPATSKCCFTGCGLRCTASTTGGDFASSVSSRPSHFQGPSESATTFRRISPVKTGECPKLPEGPRFDCRSGQDDCTTDQDCPGIKKCCSDGCFMRCLYAERTTACLHKQAAYDKLDLGLLIRCTDDGEFEDIQCQNQHCWCVDKKGDEVTGTKVSIGLRPNCQSRRFCSDRNCASRAVCPFGYVKDSNGCDTCECDNPCRQVQCVNPYQICIPAPVQCLEGICPQMPKCVLNICPTGNPLLHEASGEPIYCRDNSQCHGHNTHCRLFNKNNGFCCVGVESPSHPGVCPVSNSTISQYPVVEERCHVDCKEDDDCSNHEKCCFTEPCNLKCIKAEKVTEEFRPSIPHRKIGECPVVQDLDLKYCNRESVETCRTDVDCPSVQKCCFDGCAKSCQYADTNTECFHALAAHDQLLRFHATSQSVPRCSSDGSFEHIQVHGNTAWCVDAHGLEIVGTRSVGKQPTCSSPKNCPIISCTKQCPFGYEINEQGCPVCGCKNPCAEIQCSLNYVCRVVSIKCFLTSCTPVAKCVLNACPRGEPLESSESGLLRICHSDEHQHCPQGWFCHSFGMMNISYCCSGTLPITQFQADHQDSCASLPALITPKHDYLNAIECKMNHDCVDDGPCCYNGVGTSCTTSVRAKVIDETPAFAATTLTPIRAQTSVSLNVEKLGTCPTNNTITSGCRNDCSRDSECSDFQKCCSQGCSRVCFYPKVATPCIHRFASITQNLAKQKTIERQHANLVLQCTPDGLFRRIQCNSVIRQCWCVDSHSGVEIIGTRISSTLGQEPNCITPRFCATSCHNLTCEYGYKLDRNGCPLNGFCQCKSVCDDFSCSNEQEVCTPLSVSCIAPPCPPVPVCKPNPCASAEPLRDVRGSTVPCSRDQDCGQAKCRHFADDEKNGICCPAAPPAKITKGTIKFGECPHFSADSTNRDCQKECNDDWNCLESFKCCSVGCSKLCMPPVNATNCVHMQTAVHVFHKDRVSTSLLSPECDSRSGNYRAVQCDANNNCWCVDPITGIEVQGTRNTGIQNTVCNTRKPCSINCDDKRNVCPFGIETNSEGCPRNSNCRCRNLCDNVQCPAGKVCLLRPIASCQTLTCLPVPTCEDNPCVNNQKPAVEPRTFAQFTCNEKQDQICPAGFYCTGHNANRVGVCCPGQEPTLSQQSDDTLCQHGDAFSNAPDGVPVQCSVTHASCPNTHYCTTKPEQKVGICCVTKRYVCNLRFDPGPCSAVVQRYYYNPDDQRCVPFNYSGCSGNLNNFATRGDCEHFCIGTGIDILSDAHGGMDLYNVGFSLTGPLLRNKHTPAINSAFRNYLTSSYAVDDSEIRDLFIKDDNAVRFSINAVNAKEKASNISNAVSNGQFKFKYNGDMYKAEPQTWFLQQIQESPPEESQTGTIVFWALLVASVIFAIVILAALSCGCTFISKRKVQHKGSTVRAISPSPYGQISAYGAQGGHSPSRSTGNVSQHSQLNQRRGTKKHIFSTDDVSAMRQNTLSGNNNLLTPVASMNSSDVGLHTQGGRRPSRTTLYY